MRVIVFQAIAFRTASSAFKVSVLKKFTGLCAFLFALLMPAPITAQEVICQCHFREPPWEAIGTKAACSTYMRPGLTSCVISFGGIGADDNLVETIIGSNPQEYKYNVFEILGTYVEALKKNDRDTLTNPAFIREAIPIFMRGAFFRVRKDSEDTLDKIKQLDAKIIEFFEKYSDQVSDVFIEKRKPYSAKFEGATFSISKGAVIVEYEGAKVITVFLP